MRQSISSLTYYSRLNIYKFTVEITHCQVKGADKNTG